MGGGDATFQINISNVLAIFCLYWPIQKRVWK